MYDREGSDILYIASVVESNSDAYYLNLDMSQTKFCKDCETDKPLCDFSKNRRFKGGFCFYCKPCSKARRVPALDQAACKRWRIRNQKQSLLSKARRSAILRGQECTLTLDDFEIPTHCPIFSMPLRDTTGTGRRSDDTASIERIDNSLGYIPGNVVIISWKANRLKNNATMEELQRIVDFYGKFRL